MAVDANLLKARAAGLLKRFSGAQLVTIGLLGIIGLVGLMAFVRWASAPTYQVLYSGLAPKDAAAVTAKLQSNGVPYRIEGGGGTILVPQAQLAEQKNALAAAGLPKNGPAGYELLDKQGLMTSSFRQQVDYQRALEGELSRTVGAMSGISSATVHLVLPQDSVFADAQRQARASVMIDAGRTLPDDAVDAIVHLVASAVPELDPAAVTVTDTNGQLLSDTGGRASDKQLRLTQAYEDSLAAQASTMLDRVVGSGRAIVRVSADLDNDERTTDTESYDHSAAPVVREQTSSETYTTGGQASTGGVLSLVPTPPAAAASPGTNGYSKTDASREYGIGKVVEHRTATPGQVRRLTVAVVVDESVKNAPPNERLTALVSAAVGLDPKRGDTIVVEKAAFGAPAATPAPAAKGGSGGLAKSLAPGLGGVVLLAVLVLLATALRRPRTTEIPLAKVTAALPSGGAHQPALAESHPPALPAGHEQQRRRVAFEDVVDSRPDEVGALLRTWLAENGASR